MKRSVKLQRKAVSILDVVGGGMENNEVKAMRGIGYAVLALLQFLRESETAQSHITSETLEFHTCCNCCDCDSPEEA